MYYYGNQGCNYGYNNCSCGNNNKGYGCALILVVFILLVIIGAARCF